LLSKRAVTPSCCSVSKLFLETQIARLQRLEQLYTLLNDLERTITANKK
jgi:hypothetical protein